MIVSLWVIIKVIIIVLTLQFIVHWERDFVYKSLDHAFRMSKREGLETINDGIGYTHENIDIQDTNLFFGSDFANCQARACVLEIYGGLL